MPMKTDGAVGSASIAEHALAAGEELVRIHQFADRAARLEARIELDHRLGPEAAGGVGGVDFLAEVVGLDVRERARETLVVGNDRPIEIEDIHSATKPRAVTKLNDFRLINSSGSANRGAHLRTFRYLCLRANQKMADGVGFEPTRP